MNYEINKNGEYYFILIKSRRSDKSFEYFLKDINIDDYVYIKQTNSFRIIQKDELKKYAGVFFIEKEKFDLDNFNNWGDWNKENSYGLANGNMFHFLSRPFPNFNPFDKIKEIK